MADQVSTQGNRDDEAAFLERVRRSGISINRQGRFWHEGQEVKHLGLKQALFRWLDRLPPPENRYVLRLDAQRFAYLDVEDTPLVATSLRMAGEGALLGLQDGSEEPLDPTTLTVDAEGILRCRVRGGQLEVRLDTAAATVLADRIEDGGLRLAGQLTPIPARS